MNYFKKRVENVVEFLDFMYDEVVGDVIKMFIDIMLTILSPIWYPFYYYRNRRG